MVGFLYPVNICYLTFSLDVDLPKAVEEYAHRLVTDFVLQRPNTYRSPLVLHLPLVQIIRAPESWSIL